MITDRTTTTHAGVKLELPVAAPYDLVATLSQLAMRPGDPCIRFAGPRHVRLGMFGPTAPLVVEFRHEGDVICAQIAGPDIDWLAPLLTGLLGLDFQPPTFNAPSRLRNLARKHAGLRLPRAPLIFPRVVQIVLGQLVSHRDACHGWKELVRRHGTKAPGHDDLYLPPAADVLARLASFHFVECSILPEQGRRIVGLARMAKRIESAWGNGLAEDAADNTCRFLEAQRGVGPWTIGSLRGSSMGDSDAIVLGDYSLPKHVAYFFTGDETINGTDATDDDMLKLLQPFRPHRYYVTALLMHAPHPPRRGPRRRPLRDRMRPR